MALRSPLTRREERLIDQIEPSFSSNPVGIAFPDVLVRFAAAIDAEIDRRPFDGPGERLDGAEKTIAYTGALLTQEVWYTDASRMQVLYQLDVSYTGALPTTEVWTIYDEEGEVAATLTDRITYSGALEIERVRSWEIEP